MELQGALHDLLFSYFASAARVFSLKGCWGLLNGPCLYIRPTRAAHAPQPSADEESWLRQSDAWAEGGTCQPNAKKLRSKAYHGPAGLQSASCAILATPILSGGFGGPVASK
jgi:hypothetical protein